MIMRKHYIFLFIITLCAIWALPSTLHSRSFRDTSHGDINKLPKSCRACHQGHGIVNTRMLSTSKDVFCFRCHGESLSREQLRQDGLIASDVFLQDIRREFDKPYRHPIEITGRHVYGETLPETDPSMPRHAECVDCHHHHYVTEENKHLGLRGTNVQGQQVQPISNEYELCFNCHSYSANLPSDQTNKATLFDISNPSYHPVVGQGKNNNVSSLLSPLTPASMIKCTDCHGNDDVFGPKGPHGSNYERLLKKKFVSTDGASSSDQYELCFSCHASASILSDEIHSRHVSGVGASCRTCHNPHGSMQYTHLIDLNNISISPSSGFALQFNDLGDRAGECYLSCHGRDHNPGIYPSNATSPLSIQRRLLKK